MKRIDVQQGSREWLAVRAQTFNASEAPAMLGLSPYMSRSELLEAKATGLMQEPDAATLARFARGHEAEAQARALAEEIIGDELFPVVGMVDLDWMRLLASFDGITMFEDVIWEHKLWNASIVEHIQSTGDLPDSHWPQVEHQLLVSEAAKCLFMVSDGTRENMITLEYVSRPERRQRVIEGWKRFAEDLEKTKAEPVRIGRVEPVEKPVPGFGALVLRVEGRVLSSNLDTFRAGAEAFLARLPKADDLETDQDFADAEAATKACAEAEDRIKAAKEQAIAQMADVEAVLRTADDVAASIRQARLSLERAVKARKEQVRAELVRAAVERVREAYAALTGELGEYAPGIPASIAAEIGAAIKGLKKLDSIRDRLDSAVARELIDLNLWAERIRKAKALFDEAKAEHGALWPDAPRLAQTLDEEVIRGVIASRIAEHHARLRERSERVASPSEQRTSSIASTDADLVRAFMAQRNIDDQRIRAVLIEFIKFVRAADMEKAA